MKWLPFVLVFALSVSGCGMVAGATPTATAVANATPMIVVVSCQPCGSDPIQLTNTPGGSDYLGGVMDGSVCQVMATHRDAGKYYYLVTCSNGVRGWIDGKWLKLR